MLNSAYWDYDSRNSASMLGVTIMMPADETSFDANLNCKALNHGKCVNGQADCRMPAALYNHKMLLKSLPFDHHTIQLAMDRQIGFVINQTKVEASIGKCSFSYDGASAGNYNGGCGLGAIGASCSDATCAFNNICKSGKTCTGKDPEVTSRLCKPVGSVDPPHKKTDPQCYFSLPAFNLDTDASPDNLREMVKARLKVQTAKTQGDWNEVILDAHKLIPAVMEDPAQVILAFVYAKSKAATAQTAAKAMRNQFATQYKVQGIPVIKVEDTTHISSKDGPFILDGADTGMTVEVV